MSKLIERGADWRWMKMPSKTPKQARAMKVAATGKSTLGIPKSVGKEFVKADKKKAKKKRAKRAY